MLANWTEMNSGTAKEAYMLLVGLNLCGLLIFLLSREEGRLKQKKLLQLLWAGLLFSLISAPIWITFLHSLKQSYTTSDVPYVKQIQPSLMIGLFDDIFYRALDKEERVVYPSANFLFLSGVLWSLTSFKELLHNRLYLAICLSSLISFFLVFGGIPASTIVQIPFSPM